MSVKADDALKYGIGAVAKMTGLTDHTIRVWERRYGAVVAGRKDSGRRLYTDEDVERLTLLKRLTDSGDAISQIADLTLSELRNRAQSMREIGVAATPAIVRVALLGDLLPMQFREHNRQIEPVEICVSNSSPSQFAVDIARHDVDFVVVECPVLDADAIDRISRYVSDSGAKAGMALYRFGTSQDIDRAKDSGFIVARSPADVDQVRALILRAAAESEAFAPARSSAEQDAPENADWPQVNEVPDRLYSASQLARLSRISSAIDCECPQQLASLVTNLTAFEIYSAQCANRNEDDAALHRYLHHSTAQARFVVETALKKVVEFENIDI